MAGKRSTKEIFIAKAIQVHGFRYNYSRVVYLGSAIKVEIGCSCGEWFWQQPHGHINSANNCPFCSISRKITIEVFIERANKIHNNKYDYSRAVYINNHTKLEIGCPSGQWFWQAPVQHINYKHGCNCCNVNKKLTKETFIIKAQKVHGNKYDYSNTIYINVRTKIEAKCDCGEIININPGHHLQGEGCNFCNSLSKNEKMVRDILIENNFMLNEDFYHNYDIVNVIPNETRHLEFDFAFFDKAMKKWKVIEYNGEQHYKPSSFFYGEKNAAIEFANQQERDQYKRDACNKHNIIFIEIDGRKYKNNNLKQYVIDNILPLLR
jgi:hypothetical protein